MAEYAYVRRKVGVLLLALAAQAGEEGLLRNGGFEDGETGWVFFQFAGGDTHGIERKGAAEGKHALHVAKESKSLAMVWTDYRLGPDQQEGKLRFTARVKGKRLGRTKVWFIVWDDSGNASLQEAGHDGDLDGNFKWKTLEKTLDIPGASMGGRILVHLFGDGELWLDGVQVVHEGPAEEEAPRGKQKGLALRNGDFDRAKTGWVALPGSRELTVALDRKVKAGGGGALRLERRGPRLYPELGVQQVVKLPRRAKRVTVRCRARGDGAARACAALLAETEDGALLEYARAEAAGTEFEELVLPLALPPAVKRLRIALAVRGPGEVWFDEVVLEEK